MTDGWRRRRDCWICRSPLRADPPGRTSVVKLRDRDVPVSPRPGPRHDDLLVEPSDDAPRRGVLQPETADRDAGDACVDATGHGAVQGEDVAAVAEVAAGAC